MNIGKLEKSDGHNWHAIRKWDELMVFLDLMRKIDSLCLSELELIEDGLVDNYQLSYSLGIVVNGKRAIVYEATLDHVRQ